MSAPYRDIVVGVDRSAASMEALATAARLAEHGGRLTIIHVVIPVPRYYDIWGRESAIDAGEHAAAEAWLSELADGVAGATPVLLDGWHPGDVIVRWTNEHRPDLVVIAPHQQALARVFIGSTANFVLRNVHVPVLIVRDYDDSSSGTP